MDTAAEALQAGFLTKKEINKPETVSYLTSQVVSIMLMRSLDVDGGAVPMSST